MYFIHLLNECPILFIQNLERYGYATSEYGDKSGFEVYSIYGEIKCFDTWHDAHKWRVTQIKEFLALQNRYRDTPTGATHIAGSWREWINGQ